MLKVREKAKQGSRTVLLIAYHFPPFVGSSGIQRTLRFSQYLSNYGWKPIVLSINTRAYEQFNPEAQGNEVSEEVVVFRSFGLDAARHLSIFGYYPRTFALPDRWSTWRFFAVRAGIRLAKKYQISAIFSTFPIATAHQIGFDISQKTGLPWIAEFRDPMWQGDYPHDPRLNIKWKSLEENVFKRADRVVVTTPGAVDLYASRYPDYIRSRIKLIENGYDEEVFVRASKARSSRIAVGFHESSAFTLLHSGVVYPTERDPSQLFLALSTLKKRGDISRSSLRLILRATGHDRFLKEQIDRLGIDDIVHLEPPIEYLSALREMMEVDGLLVLQASNCNEQIPAKLYEYFRARRPILALTNPEGDTATVVRESGAGLIASLNSKDEIAGVLVDLIKNSAMYKQRALLTPVDKYSREAKSRQLADVLDEVALD